MSPAAKHRVLLVDDSPETLGMLNESLRIAGYTVLVALEGEQAIAIANKVNPDIILLDARMPVLDGFETCKQLKRSPELAGIPVIFLTGLSDTEDVLRALQAGGVDYVNKPIVIDELLARMKVHLTNAQLTYSARNALDRLGRAILCCNAEGDILWSTPEASRILSLHSETGLGPKLRNWLADGVEPADQFHISENQQKLSLCYQYGNTDGEHLMRVVIDALPTETDLFKQSFNLTNRESDVLLWIANGKTNREIGTILAVSPRTVNKHLEQIYRKLGVENRTAAAARAIKSVLSN